MALELFHLIARIELTSSKWMMALVNITTRKILDQLICAKVDGMCWPCRIDQPPVLSVRTSVLTSTNNYTRNPFP